MKPARVIGAGLSGLAAAWHLADYGFAVTVVDAEPCAGGLVRTIETPHGLVETAANAFVWDPTVDGWFQRLDLAPVFPKPASKRRYIFRDGKPRRWPLTVAESAGMAARLGLKALGGSMSGREGESMAAWGDRVIGAAAREWLLEPAMQGIYASPAERLSARAIFGGRTRGPRRLAAPPRGMGQLTSRLFERLSARGVRFDFNRAIDTLDADVPTVIATGAGTAGRLLAPHAPALSAALARVRLAPLTTVTMFFAEHQADVHGFGVLFPKASGVGALGVLFNADIFEGRGPHRSETWIVGDRDREMTRWADDRLRQQLAEDRVRLTGRDETPMAMQITRWHEAIPVYDDTILEVVAACSALPPWLALAGNYLGKIGVAALLTHARSAAERLQAGNTSLMGAPNRGPSRQLAL